MKYLIPAVLLLIGCTAPKPYLIDQVAAAQTLPAPHRLQLGAIQLPDAALFLSDLATAIQAKESPIVVEIDSPGGRTDIGMDIVDLMTAARRQGAEIDCQILAGGMAASMAAHIFEAGCSKRMMSTTAMLLFHEPSVGDIPHANEWDLRRIADALADMNHRLAILTAPHLEMKATEFEAWIKGRDRALSADEALDRHAVDAVLP